MDISKRILVFLVLGLVSTGCATNAGGYRSASAVQERLTGMTVEELSMKLGAPTQAMQISKSSEVWTYRAHSDGLTGGQCVISVTIKHGMVVSALVNKTDRSPLAAPLGSCSSVIAGLD